MTHGKIIHSLDNGLQVVWDATTPASPDLEEQFEQVRKEVREDAARTRDEIAGKRPAKATRSTRSSRSSKTRRSQSASKRRAASTRRKT